MPAAAPEGRGAPDRPQVRQCTPCATVAGSAGAGARGAVPAVLGRSVHMACIETNVPLGSEPFRRTVCRIWLQLPGRPGSPDQ